MSRRVSQIPEFKVVLIGECDVGKSSLFMRVSWINNRGFEPLHQVLFP